MSSEYGTPYIESELILSYENGNYPNVNRIAEDMSDVELTMYIDQLTGLADYLTKIRDNK